jgi:hypothetical protein
MHLIRTIESKGVSEVFTANLTDERFIIVENMGLTLFSGRPQVEDF